MDLVSRMSDAVAAGLTGPGEPPEGAYSEWWKVFEGEAPDDPPLPTAEVEELTKAFDKELDAAPGVKIPTEVDALVGSNGQKMDSYLAREQKAVSEPAPLDLGDMSDLDFDMGDYNQQMLDTQLVTRTGPEVAREAPFRRFGYDSSYINTEPDFSIDGDEEFSELTESESEFSEYDPEGELSFEDTVAPEVPRGGYGTRAEEPVSVPGLGDEESTASSGTFDAEPAAAADVIDMSGDYRGDIAFGADGRSTWGKMTDAVKGWFKPKVQNDELYESLLGDVELGDMGRATHNLPLSERPTIREFSTAGDQSSIASGLGELVGSMQERGFSPASIAQELGVGVAKGGGLWISQASLKDYLIKQGKGVIMSPAIGAMVAALNGVHDGVGDMVSLGMIGTDMLMSGDPLGVLLYGVGQLWDAANQSRQKVIDNDKPDKEYGTKMGYVREGDTWYPAIFNQRYKSTGLFASDQQITLDYGHDIVWKMDGEGKFVPMIPGAKSKNFVASDDEWLGEKKTGPGGNYAVLSSKEFVTANAFGPGVDGHRAMNDTVRDWYFLSPDEMKKVMSGEEHLESYTDDITTMNSTVRQLNDWRKALDYAQNWKWSSASQFMGKSASVNNYAGSRGLQRLMYEGTGQLEGGVFMSSETDYDVYQQNNANRTGDEFESGQSLNNTFGDYLQDTVLRDHIAALYHSQLLAAKEAGFDRTYGVPGESDKLPEEGGTVWSALYLDTAKDMPVAKDAEELNKQLHTIEMMNDRTAVQRNYLAQKAQTRYWMQQITASGGAQDMAEFLYGDQGRTQQDYVTGDLNVYRDLHDTHKYTASGLREFQKYMPDASTFDRYSASGFMQGFAMPWQNAGESFMPTFSGALQDSTVKNYFTDDRLKERYDAISSEARANTTQWIQQYGKVDPNQLIEGLTKPLPNGGILHDPEVDGPTDVIVDEEQPVKAAPVQPPVESPLDHQGTLTEAPKDDPFAEMLRAASKPVTALQKKPEPEPPAPEPEVPDDDLNKWVEMGKSLGILDDDYTVPDAGADRARSENTHTPDDTVATSAVSVPHPHSIDHEDFGYHGMSNTMLSFIHAAEAPPASKPPAPSAVKVV